MKSGKVKILQLLRQESAAGLSVMRGATPMRLLHICHYEHDEQL
jgi:hypothetical protein